MADDLKGVRLNPDKPFSEVHGHSRGWRYLQDGVYFTALGEAVSRQPGKIPHKAKERAQNIQRKQRAAQLSAARKLGNMRGFKPIASTADEVRRENQRAKSAERLSEDA